MSDPIGVSANQMARTNRRLDRIFNAGSVAPRDSPVDRETRMSTIAQLIATRRERRRWQVKRTVEYARFGELMFRAMIIKHGKTNIAFIRISAFRFADRDDRRSPVMAFAVHSGFIIRSIGIKTVYQLMPSGDRVRPDLRRIDRSEDVRPSSFARPARCASIRAGANPIVSLACCAKYRYRGWSGATSIAPGSGPYPTWRSCVSTPCTHPRPDR